MPKPNFAMQRPSAPFYVQFEVTEACNHSCFFCYNTGKNNESLSTAEIKKILSDMHTSGVFSINFNGGEPLMRPDFFELAQYAHELGFDLHLNTNGTLIDEHKADLIAKFFPSVCTSVLASALELHDKFVGRSGAFSRMKNGVSLLTSRGVLVEINVCTFQENYEDLYNIAKVMAEQNVHVFCVTRYILVDARHRKHLLGKNETIDILNTLERISNDFPTYKEVKLPGPVPYCELPENQKERLRRWNTPCQIGYGLCRISAKGEVTPCPLSTFSIGHLRDMSFREVWAHKNWCHFESFCHLPRGCHSCEDLPSCRGGCIGYDDYLKSAGLTPKTLKWKAI